MNDRLDKYFSGEMPTTEKTAFFQLLETDPEAKKEFARRITQEMQKKRLSKQHDEHGDKAVKQHAGRAAQRGVDAENQRIDCTP